MVVVIEVVRPVVGDVEVRPVVIVEVSPGRGAAGTTIVHPRVSRHLGERSIPVVVVQKVGAEVRRTPRRMASTFSLSGMMQETPIDHRLAS